MEKLCEIVQEKVLEKLDFSQETEEEQLQEAIAREIAVCERARLLSIAQRVVLEQRVFNALRKLDVLQELIEDDEVTEILVNGPSHIFYEKHGKMQEYPYHFSSEEKLQNVIQQIVGKHNRAVNFTSPIVDSRLEDGSRVNVVLSPVSLGGSALSIRKFPKRPLDMEELIRRESLTADAAEFLAVLVANKYNIFVSGGTGSGKTTFLNALSAYIPEEERVITIEDSAELQLQGVPNCVRLEARTANMEGVRPITARDLIHTALRMRPDRIVVGECRGAEALDMLQAMNTGHDGSLSTGHANSTRDMLSRLETMVLMGSDLPLAAIRQQIASGIDVLVHLERGRDGCRRVVEITEITGIRKGEYETRVLYAYENGLKIKENLLRRDKLQNGETFHEF